MILCHRPRKQTKSLVPVYRLWEWALKWECLSQCLPCPSLSLKQCPSPLWVCVSIALLTNDPQLSWKYPPSIIQRSCIEQGANVSLARCFQFQAWLGQQPWSQRVWRTFHTVAGSHSLKPSLCRLLLLMELLHILPPSQSFYSRGGVIQHHFFHFLVVTDSDPDALWKMTINRHEHKITGICLEEYSGNFLSHDDSR